MKHFFEYLVEDKLSWFQMKLLAYTVNVKGDGSLIVQDS